MNLSHKVQKAFGMPNTDSTHQYFYKSGEYGSMYQYWYRDNLGNYYRYTNAPVDHPDFDPFLGQPMMDPEQPLPEKNPEFFTQEGFKRCVAVAPGSTPIRNAAYNQNDERNIWFEVAKAGEVTSYIYLDADVKENIDLYVQHQLRVVDASLPKLRQFGSELFNGKHPKDRLTGAIIMLVDQGFYEVEELANATVGDVQFVDQTVVLLGRKFVCDSAFYDFMTSIVATRAPQDPLFILNTMHGETPIGINYLYSVFSSIRCSPKFLLNWNASHLYSRIVNRMSFQQIPAEEVETAAFDELSRTLTTREDVKYLVDYKLRVALIRNYASGVMKGLAHLVADDFGVAVVRSDLTSLRADEKEFSTWLHNEPMHDTSPAEEQQVNDVLDQQKLDAEAEKPDSGDQPPPPGEGDEKPEPPSDGAQ